MSPLRAIRDVARAERGQASVELVALLPLTLIAGIAIMAVLAARAAAGDAAAAAQAGAMALIQDGEPARGRARRALRRRPQTRDDRPARAQRDRDRPAAVGAAVPRRRLRRDGVRPCRPGAAMTSLLRRVVATFVESVDSAASPKPSSRPDTVDAPATARRGRVTAAAGGRLHAATPTARRPHPDVEGRTTTPHERSRRHPGGIDAPHASRPGDTRVARCDRPADTTRPSGDHRRDRARRRRRGGPGRGCLRRRAARPRTRRRRTPLRVAADRRADGRPRAALGRRGRRSPAVDPRGRDDACGSPARRSPRSPRTGGDGARPAGLAPARAGAVGGRRPGPPLPRDRGSARRDLPWPGRATRRSSR